MLQDNAARQPSGSSSDPSGRRIVLVEDSAEFAWFAARVAHAFCGHEVRLASNGKDGIALIESFQPDVALIDIGFLRISKATRSPVGCVPCRLAGRCIWWPSPDGPSPRTAGSAGRRIRRASGQAGRLWPASPRCSTSRAPVG